MTISPEDIRAAAEQQAEHDFIRMIINGETAETARRAVERQIPAQIEIYETALAA